MGFTLLDCELCVLILLQNPVGVVNPIPMHTPPLVAQDPRQLRRQVSKLLLQTHRARYRHTHAATPVLVMRHPRALTDAFQPHLLRAEIISWISPILSAPARCLETPSAFRSIQPLSSAHCVPSALPARTTYDPTYEHTQTSDHSYARYVAKPSPDNTTENATKDCIPAKRNSFVAATYLEAGIGAAGAGLRVQMH